MRRIFYTMTLLLIVFCSSTIVLAKTDPVPQQASQEEDVQLANKGLDYAQKGDFSQAAKYLKQALEVAQRDKAPDFYLNDLKIKLATAYINMGETEKGRALLKEVYGSMPPTPHSDQDQAPSQPNGKGL